MCLVVAGCGTNAPPPIPVVVPGQPALMTLKLGTGGWKAVAGSFDANANATTYQVEVTDDFELVGVCVRPNGVFMASEVFGTVDDATITLGAWTVPNCVKQTNGFPPPPATPTVMFTATGEIASTLSFDSEAHPLQPDMPRTFSTWQGLHDLVEVDPTTNRIFIQHDVEIDGGTSIASEVSTEGEPLLMQPYAYTPQAGEGVNVETYLLTAHGAFYISQQPDHSTAFFVPPDQLAPGDLQKFEFNISAAPNFTRGAYTTHFDQTVPEFGLLPQISGVTTEPGELGASWTPFSDFYTHVLVSIFGTSSQFVAKSKLWLERHATHTVDFDMSVDGYDPTWVVANPMINLEAVRWNQDLTLYSGIYLTVP